MDDYKIREFTPERLKEVKRTWRDLAGEDEFDVELAPFFNWCETHIEQRTGDSRAYELYSTRSQSCDAIIELVNSSNARLSKLLKLFISPEMWDVDDKREQVVNLYVSAFVQVIKTERRKGINRVKLYGRTSLMLSILHTIHSNWPAEETNSQATFEGRWLTIALP